MRMRLALLVTWMALLGAPAHADLCASANDTSATTKTKNDVDFYEQLFPNPSYHGNRRWNEIVLQCNRQRDTKGNETARVTSDFTGNPERAPLEARNLAPKVIRGHYNFFGTVVTQLKYVYVLSKKDGVWEMTIPYKAVLNDLAEDRVDFFVGSREVIDEKANLVSAVRQTGHAWQLYDASQVTTGRDAQGRTVTTLLPSAQPIALTLCTTSIFQPGKADKYDGQNDAFAYKRDKENKFISKGKIQYRYKDHNFINEGCRVDRRQELFWIDPA